MKRMTTLKALDHRITTLEDRVKDVREVQNSHSESLHELKRFTIKTDLQFAKMMKHFNIGLVTEEEVDEAFDEL